jgi:hypothetical protein
VPRRDDIEPGMGPGQRVLGVRELERLGAVDSATLTHEKPGAVRPAGGFPRLKLCVQLLVPDVRVRRSRLHGDVDMFCGGLHLASLPSEMCHCARVGRGDFPAFSPRAAFPNDRGVPPIIES